MELHEYPINGDGCQVLAFERAVLPDDKRLQQQIAQFLKQQPNQRTLP